MCEQESLRKASELGLHGDARVELAVALWQKEMGTAKKESPPPAP